MRRLKSYYLSLYIALDFALLDLLTYFYDDLCDAVMKRTTAALNLHYTMVTTIGFYEALMQFCNVIM